MVPEQRKFDAGHVLFREGEVGAEMYIIQSGSVQLTRLVDGQPATIGQLEQGDFAGEVALICSSVHATTATAVTDTVCLSLGVAQLEAMVTQSDEIAVRFIRGLAQRLAGSYEALSRVGHRDPRARVLMAIIRHTELGEETEGGVWIRRRLSDIGHEVALTDTELGEVSKLLLKSKLLRVRRDGILVPDVSRLYELLSQVEQTT